MVPAPPTQNHRHTRHTPKTIALAQQLYAGGWTPTQIRRYIAKRGGPMPSESTVRRWVIPAEAAAAAQAAKLANRRRRAVKARVIELRHEVGLTRTAIAKLIRHDHGLEARWVDRAAVQRILDEHEAHDA